MVEVIEIPFGKADRVALMKGNVSLDIGSAILG